MLILKITFKIIIYKSNIWSLICINNFLLLFISSYIFQFIELRICSIFLIFLKNSCCEKKYL